VTFSKPSIHTSANALFEVGAIDSTTLRNFDQSCLAVLVKNDHQQIKESTDENTSR
jgi:putative transcriptional regulator